MTNYMRGYVFEQEVVHALESKGFIAQRSAGSHSKIDIFAFNFDHVKFIQCKRCKTGGEALLKRELGNLRALASFCPEGVRLEVWVKEDGKEVLMGVV